MDHYDHLTTAITYSQFSICEFHQIQTAKD
jgi:hypothetical protein